MAVGSAQRGGEEEADELLQLLKGIAQSKTRTWRRGLDDHLGKLATSPKRRDEILTIYELVFRDFERADDSRWYDPYHILFSTGFALLLVRAESALLPDIELIVPAILLHDTGYYAVEDKAQSIAKKDRIVHMQEGAARAAGALWKHGESFSSEDVECIIGMIAVHDNPYIEIPIGDHPLRRALRDCDRVWVMHALSFYKDWTHKKKSYPGDSGILEFLVDRAVQFYGDQFPDWLGECLGQPSPELVEKNRKRIEQPEFTLTKTLIDKLFQRRIEEIDKIGAQAFQKGYETLKEHEEYLADRMDGDFACIEEMGKEVSPVTENRAAIRIRQELLLEIPRQVVEAAFLSVPAWDELNGHAGIVRDRTRAENMAPGRKLPIRDFSPGVKPPYDEHLSKLGLLPNDPLVVIGARNLGNNLRIVAYRKGKGLLQLRGEDAHKGQRDYHCLCCMKGGAMEAHTLRFKEQGQISHMDGEPVDPIKAPSVQWALSGQPLLWNGETNLDTIILNTYDLRHVWEIRAGVGRFGTRAESGKAVEDLVTTLVETDDVSQVKALAEELDLPRENNYFHSAIGISQEGNLVIAQLHGSFERVADRLKKAGATHAFELEEGGSVSTHFINKKKGQQAIGQSRIFASHYFRPKASALLILKVAFEEGDPPYVPVEEDSTLGLE